MILLPFRRPKTPHCQSLWEFIQTAGSSAERDLRLKPERGARCSVRLHVARADSELAGPAVADSVYAEVAAQAEALTGLVDHRAMERVRRAVAALRVGRGGLFIGARGAAIEQVRGGMLEE